MSYTDELETRLKTLLAGIPDGEQAILIREMRAIALESYRNGQKAGAPKAQQGEPAKASPRKHYQR
jgi:hypothetical protein